MFLEVWQGFKAWEAYSTGCRVGQRADLQRMAAAGVKSLQEEQELRRGLPQALCTSRTQCLQEQAEVLQPSPAGEACTEPRGHQASTHPHKCNGSSLQGTDSSAWIMQTSADVPMLHVRARIS